jgi:hypothetical protein
MMKSLDSLCRGLQDLGTANANAALAWPELKGLLADTSDEQKPDH